MYPVLSYALYLATRRCSKIYVYIFICIIYAILLAFLKSQIYLDDFFGYFNHFKEYTDLGIVPLYSNGKEFVLTLIMIGISKFNYFNFEIEFFSFSIKIINYLLILYAIFLYNKRNLFVIVLLFTSPNFVMYGDSFIRQGFSLAFLLIALFEDGFKKILFYLLSLVTHLTNFIFLPFLLKDIKIIYLYVSFIIVFILQISISYDFFSEFAYYFGAEDKLDYIDNLYASGVGSTSPSIGAYLPPIAIITIYLLSKKRTPKGDRLAGLFLYCMVFSLLLIEIPFASARFMMLILIYTPLLFLLLEGRIQVITSMMIYLYLWSRFLYRTPPTLELNFEMLVWPLEVSGVF